MESKIIGSQRGKICRVPKNWREKNGGTGKVKKSYSVKGGGKKKGSQRAGGEGEKRGREVG